VDVNLNFKLGSN